MKTENKDWKPEVGEKVWVVAFDRIHEMCITNILWERFYNGIISYNWATKEYNSEIHVKYVHPTPEAALASIMMYDLEGKEVVIPRAQDKIIEEMCARAADNIFYLSEWDDSDYAELGIAPIINGFKEIISVKDKAVIKRLIDVAYKMDLPPNPEGEARLRAAQERFKSAIGEESGKTIGLQYAKPIPMLTIEEQNAMLSPDRESYLIDKQEYFDWCLRNEDMLCMFLDSKIGGGAANGGKSDQREGGC